MASINAGRVVMGGLVAGLVINVGEFLLNGVLFAAHMRQWYESFNVAQPGAGAMVVFVLLGFIGGIVLIWMYAAMRPRLGAGPKTAAIAGLAAWTFAYFWPVVGFTAASVFPHSAYTYVGLIWGVLEFAVAGIAGAWLYQETAVGATMGATPTGGMAPR